MTTEATSAHITDKEFAEFRARADALGLAVTVRCQHCGAPLWDHRSITAGAGPICRRRHKNDPGLTPAKKSQTEAAQPNVQTSKEETRR